jgi:hypothetical protein
MRIRFYRALLSLSGFLAVVYAPHTQAIGESGAAPLIRRPNVILILMDDIGYGDIGSYGVKDAKTPNLDRLAREGVRFTDAYANGANCSPTVLLSSAGGISSVPVLNGR